MNIEFMALNSAISNDLLDYPEVLLDLATLRRSLFSHIHRFDLELPLPKLKDRLAM